MSSPDSSKGPPSEHNIKWRIYVEVHLYEMWKNSNVVGSLRQKHYYFPVTQKG